MSFCQRSLLACLIVVGILGCGENGSVREAAESTRTSPTETASAPNDSSPEEDVVCANPINTFQPLVSELIACEQDCLRVRWTVGVIESVWLADDPVDVPNTLTLGVRFEDGPPAGSTREGDAANESVLIKVNYARLDEVKSMGEGVRLLYTFLPCLNRCAMFLPATGIAEADEPTGEDFSEHDANMIRSIDNELGLVYSLPSELLVRRANVESISVAPEPLSIIAERSHIRLTFAESACDETASDAGQRTVTYHFKATSKREHPFVEVSAGDNVYVVMSNNKRCFGVFPEP
ncbi:hypothetical protein GYB59_18495 [bacterium]|nr:hypothetical protein [bacterium]